LRKLASSAALLAAEKLLALRVAPHAVGPDGARLPVRVGHTHDGMAPDFVYERHDGGIRILCTPRFPPGQLAWHRWRFRAYAHWFAHTPAHVQRMTITSSDGEAPSSATFSPSTHSSRQVPIVDAHFYRQHGFVRAREASDRAVPWQERSSDIVWRGGRNGEGRYSLDDAEQDDPMVVPRLRMVMKLRDAPGCDVKIFRPGKANLWTEDEARLGFLAEKIPSEFWLTQKFALDIDGYTNTWSNLLVRMHYGCCVLKIGSQRGYRQWYYDRIRPFEHYVPVRSDMSDLLEKIEWVRSHDKEAQEIARNGQALARTLDFESGRREAVEIISANWDKHA
jgi:hypothetical protein